MGAAPSGKPGCPLLAFCTASIDRNLMEWTHFSSTVEIEEAGDGVWFIKNSAGKEEFVFKEAPSDKMHPKGNPG